MSTPIQLKNQAEVKQVTISWRTNVEIDPEAWAYCEENNLDYWEFMR